VSTNYVKNNLPQILFNTTGGEVWEFVATLINDENAKNKDLIMGMLDLFDPDNCPEEYLKYLGKTVGVVVLDSDEVSVTRERIRSAAAVYRLKGTISGIDKFFNALGYRADVIPLWTDAKGNYSDSESVLYQYPSSRVDITLEALSSVASVDPEIVEKQIERMIEVKPIHVLLRSFTAGRFFSDDYDYNVSDAVAGEGLEAEFSENFPYTELDGEITPAPELGLDIYRHGYGTIPPFRHDGVLAIDRSGTTCLSDGDTLRHNGIPETWQGPILFRDQATTIYHDGTINHDGALDNEGSIYVHYYADMGIRHDFTDLPGGFEYNHVLECGYSGEPTQEDGINMDYLEFGAEHFMEDDFGYFIFRNGSIEFRDGTYIHNFQGDRPSDFSVGADLFIEEAEDTVEAVTDEMLTAQIDITLDPEDRVFPEWIYHDGTLLRDNSDPPVLTLLNRHYYANVVFRNAEYRHDGTLTSRVNVAMHDGLTYPHRGDYPLEELIFENAHQFHYQPPIISEDLIIEPSEIELGEDSFGPYIGNYFRDGSIAVRDGAYTHAEEVSQSIPFDILGIDIYDWTLPPPPPPLPEPPPAPPEPFEFTDNSVTLIEDNVFEVAVGEDEEDYYDPSLLHYNHGFYVIAHNGYLNRLGIVRHDGSYTHDGTLKHDNIEFTREGNFIYRDGTIESRDSIFDEDLDIYNSDTLDLDLYFQDEDLGDLWDDTLDTDIVPNPAEIQYLETVGQATESLSLDFTTYDNSPFIAAYGTGASYEDITYSPTVDITVTDVNAVNDLNILFGDDVFTTPTDTLTVDYYESGIFQYSEVY